METLLSPAFDNLSARNASKTGKGLRQIEGLLAQICLSPSDAPSSTQTGSVRSNDAPAPTTARKLNALTTDLAFQEFFRLQHDFEWNVATRLVECLERLLGMPTTSHSNDMIFSALTILQGVLLLHPPSAALFSRENHMTLLLDLLDPERTNSAILSATLGVLLAALLDRPQNIRLFESLDGIRTLASLCKSKSEAASSPEVRSLCFDCLRFYVMPESPLPAPPSSEPSGFPYTYPATPTNTSMPPPVFPASAAPSSRPSSASRPTYAAPSFQRASSGFSTQGSAGTATTKSDGSNASWSTNPTSLSSSVVAPVPGTRSTEEKWSILRTHLAGNGDFLQGFAGALAQAQAA